MYFDKNGFLICDSIPSYPQTEEGKIVAEKMRKLAQELRDRGWVFEGGHFVRKPKTNDT